VGAGGGAAVSGVDISAEAVERLAMYAEHLCADSDMAATLRAMSAALDDALAGESRKAAVIAEMEAEMERMEAALRAIELRVDGLNTRGYQQKKHTQDALDAIKAHCRDMLAKELPR
jgi:hypothetical protein